MQKLQDSVFSIVKTTNLSPAVFSFLQPTEEFTDKTPLGGILSDTKHGWLALGPKFCVIDLRSGLKIAARNFGNGQSYCTSVTSVVELPTPLTSNSKQLVISLECDDVTGIICVFHINGSQLLHCVQTDVVVTELAVCDDIPSGPFMCFDGLVIAGTKRGEVFVFDLNRSCLVDALKNISQGQEDEIHNEANAANLVFLPLKALHKIESQRDLAVDNNDHLAVLLNETSLVDGQYIFRNPDGTIRMKAKRDHIRVTVLQYIPQLASLAVGYNFGAFQIWNLLNLELEFTSQVNVECLPVTHFGFQEPCDDPRAFCYLWVVFSVIDRFEEEEFPLAVMYSLTYQGKRMLSDSACLYQEFSTATIRFQIELTTTEEASHFVGGKCVSCHTYSINSTLGDDGDDSIYTNICQLVWECWGEHASGGTQHGMLLFDLDQWYKDQMPATYRLESNAFMSTTWCSELARGTCLTLDARLDPASVTPYSHATRLEEHFYPNSLQYNCICLNTSEVQVLHTVGIQRQIINCIAAAGPSCLLAPARLRNACRAAGVLPLYCDCGDNDPEDQRRYLLSVALEARLSSFLKRCAHDWATGTHSGAGCTLTFIVDWCWKRAIELKENAKELTAPLFTSSTLPDRNVIRCLEHCVQQLTQLTGLLDAVLTKCCNLVVPDALSEMEEKYKGIGTVSLYFQVVQWFLRVGLLPERHDAYTALPYPAQQLYTIYKKRRMKLQRLEDKSPSENENESCSLLYIDQLIEHEFGGERTHNMWIRGGSESGGLYPPPSLYSLLRLYLLPDIAEEHKHSLVLYLLVDYSMVYDDVQYEEVIRRLMQFPTMFGLSNTAIKATQAFWHLDHRDFDFALDQLQCLTGNTLSEWQHNVVLSSLLAQKKTQAALQYLHVRKPAPIQNLRDKDTDYNRLSDNDKLEDWQSCCNLYLARGLVYEALDVIRMCVQNAGSLEDKTQVLNFFFKGCRNTGQLSKILNVMLLPFEEEVFIKYLKNCNEPQTSDVLIMYYLQQARYLEAEQYNNKIKSKGRAKDFSTSVESLLDVMDRESTRDALVDVVCSALPSIASTVAHCARVEFEPHIIAPKPMSVFVQARSPKNTFTYKSSFIQDTIENASETWINKPQMRRGIKRALNVEETPFICTPKLFRTKSLFPDQHSNESTPPKRAKLNLSGTPKTPKSQTPRVSEKLSKQMATLLDMPEVQSPGYKIYTTRSGAGTPQSILKNRRVDGPDREAPSPADSRYLGESDDDMLDSASNHTHYSDSKHLRFTIPTASEDGSTPSPAQPTAAVAHLYKLHRDSDHELEAEQDETPSAVSPPKKLAVEEVKPRKSYKDTVKARRSLSISANSSLSEDPNTSIESIADIPVTLINPKYTGERLLHRESSPRLEKDIDRDSSGRERETEMDSSLEFTLPAPRMPQGRKSIRKVETAVMTNLNRSVTPERMDSPVATSMQVSRVTRSRSRSRTPELSPRLSPLAPIPELPKQESTAEPHPTATMLSVPRSLRSRSRTPERIESVAEAPRLEPITESPPKMPEMERPPRPSSRRGLRLRSKTPERIEWEAPNLEPYKESPVTSPITDSPVSSPTRRSLRSRSRTPEVEVASEPIATSPRSMRSRSKTPEKLMSPKKETARSKKSLSRMVLEANTFAKTKQNTDKVETESESKVTEEEKPENVIQCTPMKPLKDAPKLMELTFSPIVNKSVLQSSSESILSVSTEKVVKTDDKSLRLNPLPAFTTINESYTEQSVLHSYQSSIVETSSIRVETQKVETVNETHTTDLKSLPAFNTINETEFGKSVLKSFQSSIAESSTDDSHLDKEVPKTLAALKSLNESSFGKSILRSKESSIAMTSDESFGQKDSGATNKDMSSLITDDSDIEMKDWGHKMEGKDTARDIQKEKEKIVEIQREINEIEDDMSDDCQIDNDSDSDEDEIDIEEEETDVGEEESSEEENESDSDQEIISIDDSDESSDSNSKHKKTPEEAHSEKQVEDIQTVEMKNDDENVVSDATEAVDPLNQAQMSMMTDDNSVHDSESVKLNYSDEMKTEEKVQKPSEDEKAQKEMEIEIVVDEFDPTTEVRKEGLPVPTDMDVVDAAQPIEKEKIKETTVQKEITRKRLNKELEEKSQERKAKGKTPERDVKEKQSKKKIKEKTPEKEPKETPSSSEKPISEKEVEKLVKEKEIDKPVKEKQVGKPDKEKEVDKPVKEKEVDKPFKEKEVDKPVKEKETEKPVEEKEIDKPVKEKQVGKPDKEKEVDKPVKEKEADKPFKEKEVDKPVKEKETEKPVKEKEIDKPVKEKIVDKLVKEKEVDKPFKEKEVEKPDKEKEVDKPAKEKEVEKPVKEKEVDKLVKEKEVEKQVAEKKANKPITEKITEKEVTEIESEKQVTEKEAEKAITEKETERPVTPSRKRTKSTSSTKSTDVTVEEPKTPRTRKRTQSTSSNKSITEEVTKETTEEPKTPRGRSKTPTTELRKILTRRASKELGERMDEEISDDILTPRRRARAKQDDSASVVSDSSAKSRGSADSDVKPSPVRKTRKKPDLSVIPEVTAEESALKETSEDIIKEYSGSRRLTRNQKAVLEALLEPGASPRRASVASSEGDDPMQSTSETQTGKKKSLPNVPDLDGPDDESDRRTESPLSFLSESRPRNRLARAASESKAMPKPARVTRKASMDVVPEAPELGSPLAGGSSPARSRRVSFTKACEALHTPKGRRSSVDVKSDSQPASPSSEAGTPVRRSRRTPSANAAEYSTPRRTRKTSEKE